MTWITVATPPLESIEQFDTLIAHMGGEPDGLRQRSVGTAGDGRLRVVSVWESKSHADRFLTEKLGPALARILGPEPVGVPEVIQIDVARSYVREPVA